MSITAGQTALASDFIASTAGAGDAGKVPKLNSNGTLDGSFINDSFGGTGDGSDGNVTISSPTTLTRDMFYNDLTVNDTLTTGGFMIRVKGTLSGNGAIKYPDGNNGSNGGNGSSGGGAVGGGGGGGGGSAVSTGRFANTAGQSGAGGGNGAPNSGGDGGTGTSSTKSVGVNGVAGGAGGHGSSYSNGSAAAGGGGSSGGTASKVITPGRILSLLVLGVDHLLNGSISSYDGSAGSGSGGGGGGGNSSGGNNGGRSAMRKSQAFC